MAGYVFLSNSTKPSDEEQRSRDKIKLTNVSRPCLQAALDMGYEVWLGINREKPEGLECELPVHLYDSHTYRSLFDFKNNWIAYRNLMNILKKNNIDVIHCNTPVGGIIGRVCGKRAKIRKIIYTAHGFHFYKGAPLLNRTIFKWAEMIMAHWTDIIITINQEDYEAAQKFKLRNRGKVYYVPGVGIETGQYKLDEYIRRTKREELGLASEDIMVISMGDLVGRKNYSDSIKAIAKADDKNLQYYICGEGPEKEKLKTLVHQLQLEKQVHFLGYRTDIKELLNAADIFLFTTKQEGLPRSMMEAMASGLPCIASKIRGNTELLSNGKGGFLCEVGDIDSYAKKINLLAQNKSQRMQMGKDNRNTILEFDIHNVTNKICNIYEKEIKYL